MTNKLLLALLITAQVSASAQDLNFSSTAPGWNNADLSKTYSNIGTPSVATVTAAYSGDVAQFAGTTFPQASASGLRTQVNFNSNTQKMIFTVTFSRAVSALTFNISEIDKASNGTNYIDRVIVTGFQGSTAVNPAISNVSVHATVSGNVITGFDQDNTTTPTTILFADNITQVVIEYDNAPGAQTNPTNQEINIGNMSWDEPLPVTLISFSANREDGRANLQWKTTSERDNAYFNIQRTTDFTNIETVGQIQGVGNSDAIQRYQWSDELTPAITSYYRLEQVDLDGTTAPSAWVVLQNVGNAQITLYPNPVAEGFFVDSPKKLTQLAVQDLAGKTVKTYAPDSYYAGLGELPSGTYLIRAYMEDGSVIQKKFLK